MTLGSLFDGISAIPLAARNLGITTLWTSEIDEAAMSISRRHFPEAEQLGDITRIDGGKIAAVDIVAGGSPCTDVSVAGKRAGIEGKQSGLFFEMIRVINEMLAATDCQYPKWVIFENVPGLLSSNNGADFRTVMTEFQNMGDGFLLDANILDSQDFGVAQRRKRVFIVAVNVNMIKEWEEYNYGDGIDNKDGNGQFMLNLGTGGGDSQQTLRACREAVKRRLGAGRADEIRAFGKGLHGHNPQGTEAGKETAADAGNGLGNAEAMDNAYQKMGESGGARGHADDIGNAGTGGDVYGDREIAGNTISTFDVRQTSDGTKNARTHAYETDRARCLDGGGSNPESNHGGICVVHESTAYGETGHGYWQNGIQTLRAEGENRPSRPSNVVVESYGVVTKGDGDAFITPESHGTIVSGGGQAGQGYPCVMTSPHKNYVAAFMGGQGEKAGGLGYAEEMSPTLKSAPSGSNTVPNVLCMATQQGGAEIMENKGPTITAAAGMSGNNQPVLCYSSGIAHTLVARGPGAVAYVMAFENSSGGGIAGTLDANYYKGPGERCGKEREYVAVGSPSRMIVRRLCPIECERLMGLPDDYTKFGHDGRLISDSARYKALGNSIVINVLSWIFEGMLALANKEDNHGT